VIHGDANDEDFWSRGLVEGQRVNLVLLAMGHNSNVKAAEKISSRRHSANVGAIAEYDDQKIVLQEAGVDFVFNAYAEAGTGFAEHVCGLISEQGIKA
jgi:hypothetical protein